MSGFIITGTDTNIGKTVFSAALAGALQAHYWKPIQSGLEGETDSEIVARLSGLPRHKILPEVYKLTAPLSPHRAAELGEDLPVGWLRREARYAEKLATPDVSIADLIGGQISMVFASAITILPHVQSGRLRAIGVSSPQRSSFLPNLPAIAETLPGYDNDLWWGVFTAAKVPKATIDRLNAEIHKTMATDELKKRFAEFGAVAAPTTPEGFNAIVKSEIAKWSKVIREANIKAE